MNQRDWFAVGSRLLGLWLLVTDAVPEFRLLLAMKIHVYTPDRLTVERYSAGAYLLHGAVSAVIGLYLLFRTNHLAGLIYKDRSPPTSAPSSDTQSHV